MEIDNFLPGSASLVEMVDKKLLISLRDGRHFYGILRSYDQFANLVLQYTVERIFLKQSRQYTDIHHGIFLIRGENVVLVGELSSGLTPNRSDLEETQIEKQDETKNDNEQEISKQQSRSGEEDVYLIPPPLGFTMLAKEEALKIWERGRLDRKSREKERNAALYRLGFSTEVIEGDLY